VERLVEMTCVVREPEELAVVDAPPEKEPPSTRVPRTERMMRRVMEVVRTAAMLCGIGISN